MSEEVATSVLAELTLPPSVISRADVARMVNDLERVDNEITTGVVREKVGGGVPPMPATSEHLGSFLRQNNLDLTNATARNDAIRRLHELKDKAPVIHMTFAVEADRESLSQIALWLRQSVHPQAVISVGLQPGLVAGVYLRTSNKVFDLSLKGALKGGRVVLEKELEALRGRA